MGSGNSHRVYGTGLLTLDLVIGPDDEQPARWFAGGTCGNVLTILSFLGWQSFPITRLNGDVASQIVRHDLEGWGVNLDFAALAPQVSTPIIVQRIKRRKSGQVVHSFSCNCPYCGSWLPSFKAIRNDTAIEISSNWVSPTVFFLDRTSRGMITLAQAAADSGALVVFEPSATGDPQHMLEALQIAHIVKYSDQRFPEALSAIEVSRSTRIEIQTQGSNGFRFRYRLAKRASGWKNRPSLSTTRIADSAGAGDWFTAALISKFPNGLDALRALRTQDLDEVFDYATAVAAWNCFFEGARMGMYTTSKRAFHAQIRRLRNGHSEIRAGRKTTVCGIDEVDLFPACPACPCPV